MMRRMLTHERNLIFAGFVALAGACATVPAEAPRELHDAKESIDTAKKADAERMVPRSMELADQKLSDAVKAYEDSTADGGSPDKLAEAKSRANEAQKLAQNAGVLANDVKNWDGGDLKAYADLKTSAANLAEVRDELKRERPAGQSLSPGRATLMAQPVAFFSTAESDVKDGVSPALEQLVGILIENEDMLVTLSGYADRRGSSTFNNSLSQLRAENVANYLVNQGIDRSRIEIQAFGFERAAAEVADTEGLQLDRRVDASFRTMAH